MIKKILFGLLVVSLPFGVQAESLRICWEVGLKPPYLELNEQAKPVGLMVELLEKTLDASDLAYEHVVLPWSRCLQALETGDVDIVPNASFKSERTLYSHYSKAVYASELVLYYNLQRFPKVPRIDSIQALSEYRVGGMHGFNYSFYKDQVNVSPRVKKRAQLFDMLKRNRIDFAVMQKNVVSSMQQAGELRFEGMSYIPDPVRPYKEYHVLVGHKAPAAMDLIRTINNGIDTFW